MDLSFMISVFKSMLEVLPETLALTLSAFLIAILITGITIIIDYYKIPILNPITRFYVSFFRGTPLIPQLFVVYFGLPAVFPILLEVPKFITVMITLALNTAAYMNETMKGALLSVPKDQVEAAYSIGLTKNQTIKEIILPQAIIVAIPPLMNSLVDIIKGSSLSYTVGLIDITAMAKIRASTSYNFFDSYVAVMILYWIVILIIEKIKSIVEVKISKFT